MLKVFLVALVLIGLGVFGMCFNIIFRKDGKFPEYEVSQNKEMRKLGIKCMHERDKEFSEACEGCALYKNKNNYESGCNSRETECRKIHPLQPSGRNEEGHRG